ncbi:MAG: nucleotide exchange factor GrpE [Candidatus Peribacteraceae bacterium]|nr:nucleotide exchange factor GrpE [Candidatus Peribacteraceae bacterium]
MITDPKKSQAQAKKSDHPAVKPEPDQSAKIAELEKKVLELTEQIKKASEVASRAQAELQNAKIRMEKDAGELRKFASEMALRKFLPTIDNLQRALKAVPKEIEANDWVKGIIALEQQFLKEVGELGLKRFESLNQPVDPHRHEVLMQAAGEAGKVVEVLEDGYELHGKVLRVAKVKVGGGQNG